MARKRARFRGGLILLILLVRPRKLERHIAAALFSLVRKKVPKKYAEGVRTLSTPGDAVKLRLRFRSACFTAIQKTPHFLQTQENTFFLYAVAIAG